MCTCSRVTRHILTCFLRSARSTMIWLLEYPQQAWRCRQDKPGGIAVAEARMLHSTHAMPCQQPTAMCRESWDYPAQGNSNSCSSKGTRRSCTRPKSSVGRARPCQSQCTCAVLSFSFCSCGVPCHAVLCCVVQEAHEAIRPTNPALLPDQVTGMLTPDQVGFFSSLSLWLLLLVVLFLLVVFMPCILHSSVLGATNRRRPSNCSTQNRGRSVSVPALPVVRV